MEAEQARTSLVTYTLHHTTPSGQYPEDEKWELGQLWILGVKATRMEWNGNSGNQYMFPAMSRLKQQTQDDLWSYGLATSLFDSWPIAIIFEECSSIEPVPT